MPALFQSWKESLSVFAPKNVKLFFLVNIKRILESYKFILLHVGWLILLTIAAEVWYNRYSMIHGQSYFLIIPLLGWFSVFFLMYLIIRPSIKRKSFNYYKDYKKHFLSFIILSVLFFILAVLFGKLLAHASKWLVLFLFKGQPLPEFLIIGYLVLLRLLTATFLFSLPFANIPIYIAPLLTFWILFMLDSNGGIRALWQSIVRGCKMVWYNYPFCFIMFSLLCLLWYGLDILIVWLFGASSFFYLPFIYNLLLPIPLSIFTIFYTKRIHEQFGLYYPQSIKE